MEIVQCVMPAVRKQPYVHRRRKCAARQSPSIAFPATPQLLFPPPHVASSAPSNARATVARALPLAISASLRFCPPPLLPSPLLSSFYRKRNGFVSLPINKVLSSISINKISFIGCRMSRRHICVWLEIIKGTQFFLIDSISINLTMNPLMYFSANSLIFLSFVTNSVDLHLTETVP